jgi:hypothetical protein
MDIRGGVCDTIHIESGIGSQGITKGNTMNVKANTTESRDIIAGMRDASGRYYDKWYRYNRNDNGLAYDTGFKSIAHTGCVVIECMHD